jgi:hypothetical protein
MTTTAAAVESAPAAAASKGLKEAWLDAAVQQREASRFLGAIDLFVIWWIVSLAIGLGVLDRRRTSPIATTLIVIYVAIGS